MSNRKKTKNAWNCVNHTILRVEIKKANAKSKKVFRGIA